MPSSRSPASEPSGSAIAARCASRSRRSSSRRCASTMSSGSASPACAAAISFRWNSARSGWGQLTSASHSAMRCVAGRRELDRPCGRPAPAGPPARDQARLLQPAERDVDLAVVDRLAQRPERVIQAGAQLGALSGLLRQDRQHDFLLHSPSSPNR